MIDKDVYLFLVRYNGSADPKPRVEERFTGFKWFSVEELKTANIKPDIHTFVRKHIQFMK